MYERRRILVWGKTRPELSMKYRETVCTGGVFESGGLIRLYPIPLRFLDDPNEFQKYRWIEADVERNLSDPRPESYRVRLDNIQKGQFVKTKPGGNWSLREPWILRPNHLVSSVEDLQDQQASAQRSLGIFRPSAIGKVRASRVPALEQQEISKKWDEVSSQAEIPGMAPAVKEIKPLRPPDFRFKVQFSCDDSRCSQNHEFGILDWEIDALYFRMRQQLHNKEEGKEAVVKYLQDIFNTNHDVRFFLGNISTHPTQFTIVGLWYPKKQDGDLFKTASLF